MKSIYFCSSFITTSLIKKGGGTGPVMPWQPTCKSKVPIPVPGFPGIDKSDRYWYCFMQFTALLTCRRAFFMPGGRGFRLSDFTENTNFSNHLPCRKKPESSIPFPAIPLPVPFQCPFIRPPHTCRKLRELIKDLNIHEPTIRPGRSWKN